MRPYLTVILSVLACCIANLLAINTVYAIEFTQTATISAANSRYDGQDLIVNGATLTIDGSHQFNSVQLLNGALLTHSLSPAVKLELRSKTFFIDASSSINLAGKGRLPTSDVTDASGGSYGGRGGLYGNDGRTNPVFGNYKLPTDLGIGGIGSAGKTRGGGAIKVITEQLTLDGDIIADGQGFNTFFSSQGGGSGGSILLDTGTLEGTGTLQASGGSGYTFYGGGGGGGGRIAVYYQSASFDLENNIINEGGVYKPLFGEAGQAGSIFLENTSQANQPPVADAGMALMVNEQADVVLSGSATDTDGIISRYAWTQLSGPAVSLINADTATANFAAPAVLTGESPTVLSFRLTVTDDDGATAFADTTVGVLASITLPTAQIIAPSTVAENTPVELDATTSSDADGTIVSYNWKQLAGPVVILSNANSAVSGFTAPKVYQDTILSFQLDVLDDSGDMASTTANITVYSVNPDDDGDELPDLWEIQYFNTLENDGYTDTDGDGATNLQEYNLDTNPGVEQQPAQPQIVSPGNVEVNTLQPVFILSNPAQPSEFPVSYEFEVYRDAAMADRIAYVTGASLSWTLPNTVAKSLTDNSQYYWRARAIGATLFSEWVSSMFFVNTENNAPGAFNISYPQNDVWLSNLTPTLSVTNSIDIDGDAISYRFEVLADGQLLTSAEGIPAGTNGTSAWTVDVPLQENNWYQWRVIATDEHGLSTVSSSEPMFFINTSNETPTIPALYTPLDDSEISTLFSELIINNSTDPEAEALHYIFELDTTNTFDTVNKQSSGFISETPYTTGWQVDDLRDNTWYHWRAKASDGQAESLWMNGRFFVNQFNDAPGKTNALNPGNQAWVGNLQPTLEVYPAADIDGDALSYEFEIYQTRGNNEHGNSEHGNSEYYELFTTGSSDNTFWQLDISLTGGNYYWRARAVDEHGLAGEWSEMMMFYADSDGFNTTPTIKVNSVKLGHNNKTEQVKIKWMDHDPDSNASISLYYDTNQYGEDGILITQDIFENPDGFFDHYLWDVKQITAGLYFVYAIIDDGNSTTVNYSNNAITVKGAGGLPFLTFKSPAVASTGKRNQFAQIAWHDLDSDSNASIDFYYDLDNTGFDGALIAAALAEDPDGKADHFLWDTSTLPPGTYYIYATISDEANSYRVYAEKPYTIKHGH